MEEVLIIRPARPEDKAAVLAFCEHTWEWGDYIAEVWDEWLTDPAGWLMVAVLDGCPVAIVHMQMVGSRECWLEGMRVDPGVRRRGVSKRLNAEAMNEARKLGATVARLAIHADNARSQQAAAQGGFEQIGTFLHYEAPAEPLPGEDQPSLARAEDLPALMALLDRSAVYPALGGLLYTGWSGCALTEEVMQEHLTSDMVLALQQWDDFQAIAICGFQDADDTALMVEYLDGTSEGIGRLAYGLRALAARNGLERVLVTIPDLLMLRDVLEGIGYQAVDSGVFWVYERSLAG
ncbi:MAG TPA: GNAT family N-acetyltransferase [Ktedonobacterales bacterium]